MQLASASLETNWTAKQAKSNCIISPCYSLPWKSCKTIRQAGLNRCSRKAYRKHGRVVNEHVRKHEHQDSQVFDFDGNFWAASCFREHERVECVFEENMNVSSKKEYALMGGTAPKHGSKALLRVCFGPSLRHGSKAATAPSERTNHHAKLVLKIETDLSRDFPAG